MSHMFWESLADRFIGLFCDQVKVGMSLKYNYALYAQPRQAAIYCHVYGLMNTKRTETRLSVWEKIDYSGFCRDHIFPEIFFV